MDYKNVYYFIALTIHTVYATSVHDHGSYHDYEEEYKNTLFDDEFTDNDEAVTKKPNGYAVTELVDDIPDPRTRGPIVVDHTINKNLNTVPPFATTPKMNIKDKDDKGLDKKKEEGIKNEKDSNTIVPIITGYFNSIKKGIVDGFNSIIRKRNYDYDYDSHADSSFAYSEKRNEPVSYFAHKFFDSLSRKQEDIF